ncbi:olfactory receptor 1052-like [Alligator sinensis]|uniref:Olfactory receptor n=1 Tax=Alligator sinensis TaxID=38654 RepID=A0A1U7S512_ALLSI|nr:olfactory receptor 1052-like [Alligator sinensis]
MTWGNCTEATEFIFSGFTDHPEFQVTFFVLFLAIYIITLVGNLGMIILFRIDPQLHIPMYFLLSNLAFVDILYSTCITPKLLSDLIAERRAISYSACVSQLCIVSILLVMECFLLAVMAYDRYAAICNPLLYTVMSPRLCGQLVAGSFFTGCMNAMIQAVGMLKMSFCGPMVIDLFFCDISSMILLSCSDTRIHHVILLFVTFLFGVVSTLIVLISYIFIISTILKIRSAEGKCKAFSTCASHLTAVIIFYGTGLFIYLQPNTKNSRDQNKVVSVFYTVVTPMLNTLIYSLRNKEVKNAFNRVKEMIFFFPQEGNLAAEGCSS